jgi:TIR domain
MREPSTTSRDVFISHSSGDADAARALRTIIEGAGYSCWMAPDDIVGTGTWTEQILGAIADSKAMIVLISTASNRSPHVSREVNLALGKGRAVLPIRIEDVPPQGSLEYLLSLVQRVDAFPPPIADHRDRVMRRLETIVQPDDTTRVVAAAAASAPPSAPPAAAPPPAPQPSAAPPPPAAPLPASSLPAPLTTPSPPARPSSTLEPGRKRSGLAERTPILLGGAIGIVLLALLASSLIFKPPGATPGPSSAAGATTGATSATSSGASGAASSAGPTSATLSGDEAAAQARLPVVDPGTSNCSSWIAAPGGEDVLSPSGYATSVARLTCSGPKPGGPPTRYAMYPTKDALDADFAAIMTGQGVAKGGACTNAIPANAGWNFPAFPTAGDLACYAREGGVQYVWTDHELRILGQWLAPDNATGLASWRQWEQARNPAEQALVDAIPTTLTGFGACVRAADDYYATALAIVACPRTDNGNALFYAGFPAADAFPNDPMTTLFFSIMSEGGVTADTSTGCYESAFGRYTWGYKQTDGSIGPSQGYLGCYQRTDTEPATAQIVWTFNRTAVMGLWDAPDVDAGTKLFDAWIKAVK